MHCRNYSINSTINCDSSSCQVVQKQASGKISSYSFNSQDLIDSEMVRVNEGEIATTTGVSRKISASYGYSVQIKFKSLVEEGSRMKVQTAVLLSPYDIGRRSARSVVSKIDRYIEGKNKVGAARGVSLSSSPGTESQCWGELDPHRHTAHSWWFGVLSFILYFRPIFRSSSATNEKE
jgi:hypothetical protein